MTERYLRGVDKPEWDDPPQIPKLPAIMRPTAAIYNKEDRTSTLTFDDAGKPYVSRFQMKGGICFPKPDGQSKIQLQGHAVLLGLDISTNIVYEFETLRFISIEHVLRDGNETVTNDGITTVGGIVHYGLAAWLMQCWTLYYADTMYYHQDAETVRVYRLKIIRSDQIKPNPYLVEAIWQEDEQAIFTIRGYVNMGRLKVQANEPLHQDLQALSVHGGEVFPPALHAATAAVGGFEQHPHRRPRT